MKICSHCHQTIAGGDYFVAGLDDDGRGVPQNVYVHTACKPGYTAAVARSDRLAPVTSRHPQLVIRNS